ncbi:MAG: hypothetical protein KKF85_07570 [Gammaproteobacteria bacterium]|nr:hypothetical protein [Rhodocyclaceae bacterium]MBU3910055.1 hypothetical protein [Gammaproteobacteria bacterium]MBU3989320.1 hypothetical protein [Gammaproteobacteria bacterium]MBU4003882.1 hypothetical protein [Gammaproteobacteria bacterium]MBU4022517.1 hypothetical protein [Gammaproteobacteria bacterium]
MSSQATCRVADPRTDAEIAALAAQRATIAAIEKELWAGGLNESLLVSYQAAFRQLELLKSEQHHQGYGARDRRHKFVIVIPVADRPQHLQACLGSLLEQCQAFGYGGMSNGAYRKITVLIADDSRNASSIAWHRELARYFSRHGLATIHFGPAEQLELLQSLTANNQPAPALARILGACTPGADGNFGHKGQAVMRNIAYLKLNEMAAHEPDQQLLFYSVDSDQEFKVKVATAQGDKEVCAVNFFHYLDEIFTQTDAEVLTGKVVGDPPVSPAVMAGNFMEDVIVFLRQMADGNPDCACRHHQADPHSEGEAAYHDMADLFGFKAAAAAYRYRCTLAGAHSEADCFAHFAHRLGSFFYGEHPTRVSHYVYSDTLRTVQAARTVYAGNYVFRPSGLKYFIPFAALRLRMSGPTLGRIVKSEIGARFVSANLPMLHKRTVHSTGQAEFRPGVQANAGAIDLHDEFERQFHGDVMLFSIERLAADGFPLQVPATAVIAATLEAVREDMQQKYNAQHADILDKLGRLRTLLDDPAHWWNQPATQTAAVDAFRVFVANVTHNFGADSPCYERINSSPNWDKWRPNLFDAIVSYPADSAAWLMQLASAHSQPV